MALHSLFVDLNYWLGELHNSMLQLQKSGVLMTPHYSIVVLYQPIYAAP